MVVSVTLNPSIDHALFIEGLNVHDANRVRRVERDAGGKGINLSRVFSELGGKTLATGLMPRGTRALVDDVLKDQGVEHDFVDIPGEVRVNISVEDGSGEPPTTFNEPGALTPDGAWDQVIDRVRRHAKPGCWIAVGGSIPPGLHKGAYADLVDVARELDVPILVDADGEALKLAVDKHPDMIKPNEDEAARFLGWTPERVHDEPEAALAELQSAARIVVLTLGADGAWLTTNNEVWRATPPAIDVRSTIGSGDSLLAGLLNGHLADKPWDEALALGVACGAATAMTDGSKIGRRETIDQLLPHVRTEHVTIPL